MARPRLRDRLRSAWRRVLGRFGRRGPSTDQPQPAGPPGAPADWVRRVRAGAPGLLTPDGDAVRWRSAVFPGEPERSTSQQPAGVDPRPTGAQARTPGPPKLRRMVMYAVRRSAGTVRAARATVTAHGSGRPSRGRSRGDRSRSVRADAMQAPMPPRLPPDGALPGRPSVPRQVPSQQRPERRPVPHVIGDAGARTAAATSAASATSARRSPTPTRPRAVPQLRFGPAPQPVRAPRQQETRLPDTSPPDTWADLPRTRPPTPRDIGPGIGMPGPDTPEPGVRGPEAYRPEAYRPEACAREVPVSDPALPAAGHWAPLPGRWPLPRSRYDDWLRLDERRLDDEQGQV